MIACYRVFRNGKLIGELINSPSRNEWMEVLRHFEHIKPGDEMRLEQFAGERDMGAVKMINCFFENGSNLGYSP